MKQKRHPIQLSTIILIVGMLIAFGSGNHVEAQGSCDEATLLGIAAGGTATLSDESCTIVLTQPIVITGTATITGTGARISGNDLFRVIEVKEGANLTLTNVTLQDGRAPDGAGLYNAGTAHLDKVTISSNLADSFGAGVFNNGTMTIKNSSISVNSLSPGGSGGGVVNAVLQSQPNKAATLEIFNSTIFGNNAPNLGGGVYNDNGNVTIRNSTIVGNTAFNNGGGIFNTNLGTVSIQNTIVAGNNAASNADCVSLENSLNSSFGYNLVGQNASANGCPSGSLGDLVLQNGIDAVVHMIGQINGMGPATLSFVPNSPALNTGDPNFNVDAEPTDQRGLPRKVNDRIDIGAFEEQIPVGQDDEYVVPFNNPFSVAVAGGVLANDIDPDNDNLTVTMVDPTKFGTLFLNNDGSFTYRPHRNFRGEDLFVYRLDDGNYQTTQVARLVIRRDRTGCDPTEQVEVDSLSIENPHTLLYFPRGTLSGCVGNPSYQWQDIGSSVYNIFVTRINTVTPEADYLWLELKSIDVCGEGSCIADLTEFTPEAWLENGSYAVWMCAGTHAECELSQPWYDAGGETTFNINISVGKGVTFPTTIDATTRNPIIDWTLEDAAQNLSWFQVYLAPSESPLEFIINATYSRKAVCTKDSLHAWNGTQCSLQVTTPLEENAEYIVYIKGWGPGGFTTDGIDGWTGPLTFIVRYNP